jgi:hypothetical protein
MVFFLLNIDLSDFHYKTTMKIHNLILAVFLFNAIDCSK